MRYRKLPVEIEAEIYRPGMEDGFGYRASGGGVATVWQGQELALPDERIHGPLVPMIRTLEGYMTISEGDYIITGVRGEKYPCKPDIFAQTYEVAE